MQNIGYMCITAHFTDKHWNLQKKIINFQVPPASHRGEQLAQAERKHVSWVRDLIRYLQSV